MKAIFLLLILLLISHSLFSAGVVINKNQSTIQAAILTNSHYEVDIQDQVAAITLTETFQNNGNSVFNPRYYYPLPRGAGATQLRWQIHGNWYAASIAGTPQNPQGGPSTIPNDFGVYIGLMPVVFDFNDTLVEGETIVVELTYVQLLTYTFGNINLLLRNDYTAIQTAPVQVQSVNIELVSERIIQTFTFDQPSAIINNNGHEATANIQTFSYPAMNNYNLTYSLQQDEIGFQSMSTLRDTIPDTYGPGFFTFIVEPSSETVQESLPNKITLVIDHSGSMNLENKITQAKQACTYILNSLNQNDQFNVVAFDHQVTRCWVAPVANTTGNLNTALQFINNISAVLPNGTNISDALAIAIAGYNNAPLTYRNIIFMITDGQPTVGITDTYQLVNYIDTQVENTDTYLSLFNFGVGSDVNVQLLTMLSNDNHGNAVFLGNNEIYTTITNYFDMMNHSPMVNPVISVTPNNVITEIYPDPTPNMYQASQFIITGRYSQPQPVHIEMSGYVGQDLTTYEYDTVLSETVDPQRQFLPKLWAGQKIDHLLLEYYQYNPNSSQALSLKQQIIDLSLAYGVICVFTSFTGGTDNDDETIEVPKSDVVLLGNFPNPFNPVTTIRFKVQKNINAPAFLNIYNIKGQIVRHLAIRIRGANTYEIMWDGKDDEGNEAGSGAYFYKIQVDKYILTGKMVMIK